MTPPRFSLGSFDLEVALHADPTVANSRALETFSSLSPGPSGIDALSDMGHRRAETTAGSRRHPRLALVADRDSSARESLTESVAAAVLTPSPAHRI